MPPNTGGTPGRLDAALRGPKVEGLAKGFSHRSIWAPLAVRSPATSLPPPPCCSRGPLDRAPTQLRPRATPRHPGPRVGPGGARVR